MSGAFWYLTIRGWRNRCLRMVRKLRSPRYLLAVIVGVAYFYLIFWRNPRHMASGQSATLPGGIQLVVLVGLLLGAVAMWVLGGESIALAFTQAEASILFPAPVSRRQLVAYKLLRGQIPLLFNALLWVLLLDASSRTLPGWARFLSIWLVFCTIYLHRLGSTLVRTAWGQHGLAGVRRNLLSFSVFGVILLGVAAGVWPAIGPLRAAVGWSARVSVLAAALASAPARYVLWPFSALVAPVFAISLSAWLLTLPGALLVLLVHVWWVMHTDTAFEEAALAATAERARRLEALRSRRGALGGLGGAFSAQKTKKARLARSRAVGRGRFALSPVGHPAVGIVWKNLICLRRTAQVKQLWSFGLLAAVGGFAIGNSQGPWAIAVAGLLILVFVLFLMGPAALRGDLRQDLQHLAGLKTLPFRGSVLVAAEVLSVAIPLGLLEVLALLVAVGLAQAGHLAWAPVSLRMALVAGLVPALMAFTCANVVIQNGMPILFPGWSRLGAVVPGGVEMMGQMILLTLFYLLFLVALMIVPVAAAFAAVGALYLSGAAALLAGLLAGAAILAFELQGLLQLLGKAFEKLEPSSVSG